MAQLSDDCFAFDGPLMRLDDALALLEERISPLAAVESAPLDRAGGRYLAADLVATRAVPPYRNSAVDGYAVYYDDLSTDADTVLPVAGRVAAGHPLGRSQHRGEAVRIFTGAPMPEGPDTVMMQEDCREDGGRVAIRPGIRRGSNTREAGEDVKPGDLVLRAGMRLRPQDIGAAAAQGLTELPVRTPLRAVVLSTGDEVREPGEAAAEGELYDSNRHMIAVALRELGCLVEDRGVLPDRREAIAVELADASAGCDLIVTSGGMSTGEEDHVRTVVDGSGGLHFWRLAIKPGRPVGLGRLRTASGAVPVIGLPGNPVAAFTTFFLLGRPLIRMLAGGDAAPPLRHLVTAGFEYRKKAERREFVRVRLESDPTGGPPIAQKAGRSGAGILSSLVQADGFVDLPEDLTELDRGATVAYLPFSEVLR